MRVNALLVAILGPVLASSGAAAQQAAGKVWTQEEMFRRNVGTREDQTTPFTPHKVIGNIYYVGTRSLASFLVTTPDGHILINTNYEAGVPGLKDSVEKLGFKFSDIKIVLGQPRPRRSHGGRRARQGDDRRPGDGDGRGRAGARADAGPAASRTRSIGSSATATASY